MPKKKREHSGARWGAGGDRLVTFAGIGAEVLCEFVGHADKRVGIGRCRFLSRDVGPNCRVLAVEVEPLFEPWLRVGIAAQLPMVCRPSGWCKKYLHMHGSASV